MLRILDIVFSFCAITLLVPIFFLLFIIGFFDTGSPIISQERVGLNQKPFLVFKFRTMYLNTPIVATHLVEPNLITRWGSFLRKSKLDELPQLLNVLIGNMSFVGPRPNLFNQIELIQERRRCQIYTVRPGITGLAQIQKIDMSTPKILAETDAQMIKQLNVWYYLKYIFLTLYGKGFGDIAWK